MLAVLGTVPSNAYFLSFSLPLTPTKKKKLPLYPCISLSHTHSLSLALALSLSGGIEQIKVLEGRTTDEGEDAHASLFGRPRS